MLQRKTVLVSFYYHGKEPVISLDDWDDPAYLFLNDSIQSTMRRYNPDSKVFDVAIDETRDSIFRVQAWWSRYVFKLLRKRG